jgi:hypothetical protein
VAIGRKSWLLAGSDAGARHAAIVYSIIATCERHATEPLAALRDIPERVATQSSGAIAALFPPKWKPAQEPSEASPTDVPSFAVRRRALARL